MLNKKYRRPISGPRNSDVELEKGRWILDIGQRNCHSPNTNFLIVEGCAQFIHIPPHTLGISIHVKAPFAQVCTCWEDISAISLIEISNSQQYLGAPHCFPTPTKLSWTAKWITSLAFLKVQWHYVCCFDWKIPIQVFVSKQSSHSSWDHLVGYLKFLWLGGLKKIYWTSPNSNPPCRSQ